MVMSVFVNHSSLGFDICNHIINHGNKELPSHVKVKGQGHSASAPKSLYLTNI